MSRRVLVVCTGNICRSPLAVGLLVDRLAAAGLGERVAVASAGLYALDGQPASRAGVELLAARGIDISGHVAHTLTDAEIAGADLVLVMEEAQRRAIFYRVPHLLHKVLLFSELSGSHEDIADPYGRDRSAYAAVIERLELHLERGWPHLLQLLDLEP